MTVGRKANGKLDRRHRSGKTVEAVKKKLRELLKEVDAGRTPRPGKAPTVEDWFSTWLTDIAPYGKRALAPRSLYDYWSRCRNWIFPHLGAIRIDALEPDHLDKLYKAMYQAELAEGTVLKTHAVVRRGLEIAYRRERVTRNVAKMIDPPGSPSIARESLGRKEIRAVLQLARERRNGTRWFLGLAVGPRQGETLGLRWPDLDLEEGTVAIQWQLQRLPWQHGCEDPHACGAAPRERHPRGLHRTGETCPGSGVKHDRYHKRGCPKPTKGCPPGCTGHASKCPQRTGGGLVFTRPKGWRRRPRPRVAALPPSLVVLLSKHHKAQAAERLEAGNRWHDLGLVFCHRDGRPIDPRVDWQEWKDLLLEAGVPPARVHVMRHSAATTLLDLGVDLSIVQEVLGHTDSRTTRGYQDVTAEITKRAARAMERELFGDVASLDERRRRRRSS
ncbi:tyrosine-type recombinase/integrase [Micromonospora aurantiaca]|uniref:tyrosine-type recombinase/integrase n=1 Tax=Micromonospora aurantiaca (nom. illeg.) TaxID=47850 RepID=UPI003445E90A